MESKAMSIIPYGNNGRSFPININGVNDINADVAILTSGGCGLYNFNVFLIP